MALTNIQKNVLDELQALAMIELDWKSRARNFVEMYGNEGIGSLTDSDIQSIPSMAQCTASEVQGAKNAVSDLSTAIGEYVAGTAATKLIKVVPNIP
jgi:hypothetical protein